MKETFWNKRIPTLLGIFLIGVGIILTTYLVQAGVVTLGRAAPGYTPENIRISNITNASFTVSYITKEASVGSISYGSNENLSEVALDDRDQQSGSVTPATVHYVTIRNLQPKSKYFFRITSNQTTFLNNDAPFFATTALSLTDISPVQKPLIGKIIFKSGKSKEAIVYLTAKNAQTISTLVNPDGSYILPLNSLRNQELTSYVTFENDQIITMLVASSEGTSSVILSADQINPVPQVFLANNYDFTLNTSPVSTEAAVPIGFPSFSANLQLTKDPQIVTPKKDEGFIDDQPLLRGIASPGAEVKIIIHSEDLVEDKIVADKNGNWTYRPKVSLAPGEHSVSIITRNKAGILKTITQSFIVYASGTQIALATPSAAPIPSNSSTPAPQVGEPTPTQTVTPSKAPIVIATNTPFPIVYQGPLPPPGSSSAAILSIAGISTVIIATLLFLLTRGGGI